MSGLEPIYIPVIIAAIQTGGLILSEYLGSRTSNNPNACRSILGLCVSTYNYLTTKKSNQPEEVELKPSASWVLK